MLRLTIGDRLNDRGADPRPCDNLVGTIKVDSDSSNERPGRRTSLMGHNIKQGLVRLIAEPSGFAIADEHPVHAELVGEAAKVASPEHVLQVHLDLAARG